MLARSLMLSLLSPMVLMGCAQPPFYESHAGAPVANLRVLTGMQGTTFFTTRAQLDCKKDSDDSRLGVFSPMLFGDFVKERAGVNHKLSLPGGEGLPYTMFSEWKIDAEKPFFIHAYAVIHGGTGYVVGNTYVANNTEVNDAAGFTPHADLTYEVTYGLNEGKPELHLFEIATGDTGQVTRTRLPFDLGSLRC